MKLILAFVFLCLWCSANARCVMYDDCAVVGGFAKPCPVDMDPKPFTENMTSVEAQEAVEVFANLCPDLALDENGNIRPANEIFTCCTYETIVSINTDMLMAEGLLGRCPTCMRNFARNSCEMNCSPEQAKFLDVHVETTADGVDYVNVIDYRIHSDFMDATFESCANVIMPQTGQPAVNVMCGNSPGCDADSWFKFIGDTAENPLAPVHVNVFRTNTTEDSMNAKAPPCNEALEGDIPCSCVDCLAMCPVGTEPVVLPMCTVLSMNCLSFSIAISFFVIFVTIFTVITIREYRRMRQEKKAPHPITEAVEVNKITRFFQLLFSKIGLFSVKNPILVIMVSSWLVFAMFFGVIQINLTSDPLELWSSPDSRSRQELNYYNSRFGPFYRTSQVFLTIELDSFEKNNVTFGPAFRLEALEELVKLENAIFDVGRDKDGPYLENVCYAPNRQRGADQLLSQCVYMSASIYLGTQKNNINSETYLNNIQNCINNPYGFGCLADWGGGAEAELTFGGYDDNVLDANTLLITLPLQNHLLQENLQPALEWERMFLELMHDYAQNWKSDFINVAYSTERSIEDEIIRVSVAEAVPIVVSYIVMFLYVIIALGNIRSYKTWFIDSKVTVAVGSFVVVVMAIFCAMGAMGYVGTTITLLAINVIPFFILSVGIDNVFLMINTIHDIENNLKQFEDYKEDMEFDKKRIFIFEKMLIRVGPSMFVSSVTQITCFAVGTISNFPAVKTFAVFASLSLTFLFIFQITTVVALLSIDFKRTSQNRFDVFWCIRKKMVDDETPHKSIIQRFMKPYSKFILNWKVKICVVLIFVTMVSVSIAVIPDLTIGLDQEMALPPDSYVYKYLLAVTNLLRLGPPVFFVVKSGLNYTDINHQNAICGGQLCNEDSLITQVFLASRYSDVTYIARSSNSWLDDFIDWSGLPGTCCKYNTTDGGFCQSTDNSPECSYCSIGRYEWNNGLRPHPEAFENYIPFFLQDEPSELCNKGGLASYAGAVNYLLDSEGRATVTDTNFMAYHTSLSTSQDFINAVKYGYEISENITRALRESTGTDVEVFPYSVFYVFFAQYLTTWSDTLWSLLFCILAAIVFNLLASGFSIITTFTVMFTTILVVINMMGVMYFWNIPLNAVSNINLIVSIGIAVEFCSHMAYAFIISKKRGDEKVQEAVQNVGATVITGITFTNIPIIVLAFSYTEIIEVFFFRMLFSLVVLGFLHGMVFYPVFLSYVNNLRSRGR